MKTVVPIQISALVVALTLAGAALVVPLGAKGDFHEIITVAAKGDRNKVAEAAFQEPYNDKMDLIKVNNSPCDYHSAGSHKDPIDDGVLFIPVVWQTRPEEGGQPATIVTVEVEGRQNAGVMYWVGVTLTGGSGGGQGGGSGPRLIYAEVDTKLADDAPLYLKDKHSGIGVLDEDDTDPPPPAMLHCDLASDLKADVEFWLSVSSGTYPWTIKKSNADPADPPVASGNLTTPTYRTSVPDLDATGGQFEYILEVKKDGDATFKRKIKFVTFVRVASVEWITYGTNTTLSTCPKNGGKRMYPGDKSYGDSQSFYRPFVWVKVKVTPPMANCTVYLHNWDVDDPSTNVSPVDTNDVGGEPVGFDNKETILGVPFPGWFIDPLTFETMADFVELVTNDQGEATILFRVGWCPGDNYRIAASTVQAYITNMTQAQADGRAQLPLGGVVAMSEMLTVWRNLHIERDYMGQAHDGGDEGNRVVVSGAEYDYDQETHTTTIDIRRRFPSELDDEDQFEGGTYSVSRDGEAVEWEIISSAKGIWYDKVVVRGEASAGEDEYSQLWDDDDDSNWKTPFVAIGTVNPLELGRWARAFEDAYINAVYAPETYTDEVDFNRNMTDSEFSYGWGWDNEQDTWSSYDWWACLTVSCFQGPTGLDLDPDNGDPVENSLLGATSRTIIYTDWDNSSATYRETIRDHAERYAALFDDFPDFHAKIMAHEIGHTSGGETHPSGNGIMDRSDFHPQNIRFCNAYLNQFRSFGKWSVNNADLTD